MVFTRVCTGDPLLRLTREVFDANPMSAPDTRIKPMVVLAASGSRVQYFGELAAAIPTIVLPKVRHSQLANMSGQRSAYASVEVASAILGALLTPLAGVPVAPEQLKASFGRSNASSVSVFFPNPRREYIDLGELGAAIDGAALPETPSTRIFLDGDRDALLVDSVILSDQIGISVRRRGRTTSELGFEPFGSLKVSTAGANEVIVKASAWMPFAFSCLRVSLDREEGVTRIISDTISRRVVGWSHDTDDLDRDVEYVHFGAPDQMLSLDNLWKRAGTALTNCCGSNVGPSSCAGCRLRIAC